MNTATIPQQSSRPTTGPIIVGIDHSPTASDALALGHVLAGALGCSTVLADVHPVKAAKGLRALAEREDAVAIVVGSSFASTIAGSAMPVAVAPSGYAETEPRLATVGCAFDGSETSRAALRWAAALAGAAEARLRIMGVHERVPVDRFALTSGLSSPAFGAVVREQQEKRLTLGAVEFGYGLDVEPQLRDGRTTDVLVDASATLDLLVLGTRGLGRIRGAVLGSVSAAVVRGAHSPVVVVPTPAR